MFRSMLWNNKAKNTGKNLLLRLDIDEGPVATAGNLFFSTTGPHKGGRSRDTFRQSQPDIEPQGHPFQPGTT